MPKKFRSKPQGDSDGEVREKPHPLLRVPGIGNRARWNRKFGRWVVPRVYPGGIPPVDQDSDE